MKNQTLRFIGGGIAAALLLATVAQAEDLPLENPDFAEGLAGWTASGWGNDEPGMVYSTTAGGYLYQTVPAHTIRADKLKYTVRYRIGSMEPTTGWEFPQMTVNLVTHAAGEGFANKGGRAITAPTEHPGEWQEKSWILNADTAGKTLAVSFNLDNEQNRQVAAHLYEVRISCEPGPAPLSLRAERRWPKAAVPQPIKDGSFAGLYREGPPGDAAALRADFDSESGALIHLGVDTEGDGLVESPNSGNEGTFAMEFGSGSSAYDTVNSGHKDAFINIQVYRAWLGLAEMAEALGKPERAAHWRERAEKLRAAFRPCFYNPKTGWLGWWRSRDGVLHDYASPWGTGYAVEYRLLSPEEGRPMLEKLWAKIDEVGFARCDLGIPTTLLPIKPGDYHYGPGGDRTVASHPFKHYLNGGCCVSDTFHFLIASHMAGLGDRADRVLAAMLQRQWAGAHENGGGFQNGIGGGGEFYTWDGTPCGYEGHLTYSYTFLQAALLREPAFRERLSGKLAQSPK